MSTAAATEPKVATISQATRDFLATPRTMLIDGEVQYACIAKLHSGLIQLDPVPNLPVLRDLVTDSLSHKERF